MITREWCRNYKGKSREKLDEWLNRYADANFEAGIEFAVAFVSCTLREKAFVTYEDIENMRRKYSGAAEKQHILPMDYKDPEAAPRTYDSFKL